MHYHAKAAGFLGSVVAAVSLCSGSALAQEDFYKGRTIAFICGFAAGGGYDLYARLISRHMGRFIPGQPNIVVQNMTGAGSVRASNHVYNSAVKDGTVVAAVNQNMPMYQMLGGKSAQFDAARLQWIGGIVASNGIVFTWHTSPTKTIEDAKKRETLMGSSGTNSDSHIFPTLINNLLGTRFKTINGYTGGAKDIHLAVERGEVEGRGGASWVGVKSSNQDWIDQKKLNVLVQIGLEPDPELKHVRMLSDLVATEADRQAVSVVTMPTVLGFSYWLAPEVPAERVAMLRRALDSLVKDSEFLADAEKQKLEIKHQSGSELEALVKRAAALPKPVLERTARLLEWK